MGGHFPKEELKKLIKFGVTGCANTLIDLVISTLLLQVAGVGVYLAKGVGYCAGMLNSYLVNRSWTFQSKQRAVGPQLIRFVVTNGLMLGVSMLLIGGLTRLGLPDFPAMVLSTGGTLVLNFIISRLWVFK